MAILRQAVQGGFTQLPNLLITDKTISAGAVRVAAYLFSRPDGWEVRNSVMAEDLGIKDKESISKYLRELITAGWVTRARAQKQTGELSGGYDYQLNLVAVQPPTVDGKNPFTGNHRLREKPVYGKNPPYSNTKSNSNTETLSNAGAGTCEGESKAAEPNGFDLVESAAKKILAYLDENEGQKDALIYVTGWDEQKFGSFNEEIIKWLFYSDSQQMLTNPERYLNKFGFWLTRAKNFHNGKVASGPIGAKGAKLIDAQQARAILERAMSGGAV